MISLHTTPIEIAVYDEFMSIYASLFVSLSTSFCSVSEIGNVQTNDFTHMKFVKQFV